VAQTAVAAQVSLGLTQRDQLHGVL
jgi:hypothetical protein